MLMSSPDLQSLQDLRASAYRVREHVIRMATDGGCFIGASLSAVDIIVYLYKNFLDISSHHDPKRDYFFLSKGHDVPALYGTFAEIGYLEKERLKNHLGVNDSIYWHPNRKIPGVEFHSGSLGHLLPIGVGVAMDAKMRGYTNKVVVLTGDGELDEGSNWEALLVAHAYKLDNLLVVVDRNEFQANIKTEELIPLEPLEDKFRAFGSHVATVDGHDFTAMNDTFQKIPFVKGAPSVVIAKTRRGKGLPSIEARADRWFCNFSHSEIESLLEELKSGEKANLSSETLVVR
jgi:transketolase